MLVLTRKAGEGIMIGDEIEIRVNRIEADFVKIGIRAPRDLPIYRDEVYKQIKESNLGAVRAPNGRMPKLKLPSVKQNKTQDITQETP
jgi:carbon storage regulator